MFHLKQLYFIVLSLGGGVLSENAALALTQIKTITGQRRHPHQLRI
jgi:hypothetical protein